LLPFFPLGDNLGLTYNVSAGASITGFGGSSCNFRNHALVLYYACSGGSSGNDTVTQLNNGGTGYSAAIIMASFRGVACTVDGAGVSNNSLQGTTGTQSGGNITTTQIYDLIAVDSLTSGASNLTAQTEGAGYHLVATQQVDWGGADCGPVDCVALQSLEYKFVPAASVNATEYVFSVGSNNNAGIGGQAFGPGNVPGTPVPHRVKEIRYRNNGGSPCETNLMPAKPRTPESSAPRGCTATITRTISTMRKRITKPVAG
jgi:hypothetical protein